MYIRIYRFVIDSLVASLGYLLCNLLTLALSIGSIPISKFLRKMIKVR